MGQNTIVSIEILKIEVARKKTIVKSIKKATKELYLIVLVIVCYQYLVMPSEIMIISTFNKKIRKDQSGITLPKTPNKTELINNPSALPSKNLNFCSLSKKLSYLS
jgi:hypothetical protein